MAPVVAPVDARYREAVALLRALSGSHGIRASASHRTNYRAIFTRDAVMAGVAGLLIEDAAITDGLVQTLTHLRQLQGPQGQVASNYELSADGSVRVSFGTLAPRIDAATWYLIGVALGARARVLDPTLFRESVRAVVDLLAALEYNERHLIYLPPGGNWADEYVYEGYTLVDQVLRAWGLRLLASTYEEPAWARKAALIERAIEFNYWPTAVAEGATVHFHSPVVAALINPGRVHPVASFSPTRSWDIFDLAACTLLGVSGVAPRIGSASLDWIVERFLGRSELPPVFHPVIDETHPDWPALSRHFLFEFRNRPYEYHNGGIWLIWVGWLALALARTHRGADLHRLQRVVEERLGPIAEFQFDEFLHGKTGMPGGTTGMAYSAAGVVFLNPAAHARAEALSATDPRHHLELKSGYFALATALHTRLTAEFAPRTRGRFVIGIGGESGSGKSVTATCLAAEFTEAGLAASVIHQDDYFRLPPRANHANRVEDLRNVGPHEVDLTLLQSHIAAFRDGRDGVTAPRVDYPSDRMLTRQLDFARSELLIVEGTYVLPLPDLDVRIFLRASHDESAERRRARNRDPDTPFIERVLAIEHELIRPQLDIADIVINPDFQIAASS
ncbi:MAG: hypothetical protein NVS4B3_24850 [Gemmatimonadaceae bacterium]